MVNPMFLEKEGTVRTCGFEKFEEKSAPIQSCAEKREPIASHERTGAMAAAAAAATGLLLAVPAGVGSSIVVRASGCGRCSWKQCWPSLRWSSASTGPSRFRSGAVAVQVQSRYGGRDLAARDREIEFGKFKGSLLGTMSSKYLKWMVKNLRGGPMSEWVAYAEEVLEDPYYKDRLEWEKVEKLMTMAHDLDKITGNRDVLAPAKVFGWNLEDDSGWRKVNFALLGTTRGGRIPRVKEPAAGAASPVGKKRVRRQNVSIRTQPAALSTPESASQGSLRDELARRRELRRDRLMANRGVKSADIEEEAKRIMNPFPGRDSIVSKVRSYDISD
ncbi:hypothetical protein AXG93_2566s1020 [Marchantia polymorpha subsp. ruderalis]|uniref:Uncharacterized protein n=1 Tax=Marchantia polymorpha subsp. ruderalis TaxID=1480154 RepID=A0A176VBN3_MARPO|nr:hypothetical protein AXG93_2566s1020 [Marchantia polymorpha subsp. ruderalis]